MIKWNPIVSKSINPDPLGEPEGEILDPKAYQNHSSLVTCATEIGTALNRKYPGWAWAIQINEKGRMINIFNHALHRDWGYTIRADEIEHGNAYKIAVKGGGEILERFGQPRGPFDMAKYVAMEKDFTGQGIPILNDLEHAQARRVLKKRKLDEAIRAGRVWEDSTGRVIVNV